MQTGKNRALNHESEYMVFNLMYAVQPENPPVEDILLAIFGNAIDTGTSCILRILTILY